MDVMTALLPMAVRPPPPSARSPAPPPGTPPEEFLAAVLAERGRLAALQQQHDALGALVGDDAVPVADGGLGLDGEEEGGHEAVEVVDARRPRGVLQVLQVAALCWCGARATHNARVVDGVMVVEGDQVVVGDVNVDQGGQGAAMPESTRPRRRSDLSRHRRREQPLLRGGGRGAGPAAACAASGRSERAHV